MTAIKDKIVFNVKKVYFDSIKAGAKGEEFRLCTPYWQKRIAAQSYEFVEIRMGYPAKHEDEKHMMFRWKGWKRIKITHPHFGDSEVEVYAVDLSERLW